MQAKDPHVDERLKSVLGEPRQSNIERKSWKNDNQLILSHGERWDESPVALSKSASSRALASGTHIPNTGHHSEPGT